MYGWFWSELVKFSRTFCIVLKIVPRYGSKSASRELNVKFEVGKISRNTNQLNTRKKRRIFFLKYGFAKWKRWSYVPRHDEYCTRSTLFPKRLTLLIRTQHTRWKAHLRLSTTCIYTFDHALNMRFTNDSPAGFSASATWIWPRQDQNITGRDL